jgi:hypothetical protein
MPSSPERRVNLSAELEALRQSLDSLTAAVVTSFDEDHLREAILAEQRRERRRVRLLAVIAVAFIVLITVIGIVQSRANHTVASRIADCSVPKGRCYQEQRRTTAAAVQAVLDGISGQFAPHRLRNEAENLCQVEIFAELLGPPDHTAHTKDEVVGHYKDCVTREAGGIPPPALPANPYNTTTTTR